MSTSLIFTLPVVQTSSSTRQDPTRSPPSPSPSSFITIPPPPIPSLTLLPLPSPSPSSASPLPPPPQSPSTTEPPPVTSTDEPSSIVLSTPQTTIIVTSIIVTQPDGGVITSEVQTSTTLPAGATIAPPGNNNRTSASSSSVPLGAIIGGAVGGGVVLLILVLCVFMLVRRNRRKDDDFTFDGDFNPDRFAANHSYNASSTKLAGGAAGFGGGGPPRQPSLNKMREIGGDDNIGMGGRPGAAFGGGMVAPYVAGGQNTPSPHPSSQVSTASSPYRTYTHNVPPGAGVPQRPPPTRMGTMPSIPVGGYLPPQQQRQQYSPQSSPEAYPNLPNPFTAAAVTSDRPQPQRQQTYPTSATHTSSDSGYRPSSPSGAGSAAHYTTTSTSGQSSDYSGGLNETAVREKQREAMSRYGPRSVGGTGVVNPDSGSPSRPVVVHQDGGRLEPTQEHRSESDEIPPTYESIRQDR